MNKAQLFKSASDCAYATLGLDGAAADVAAGQQFQQEKLDPADYGYWKATFTQCRNQFMQLAAQDAPSAAKAKQPAAASTDGPAVAPGLVVAHGQAVAPKA